MTETERDEVLERASRPAYVPNVSQSETDHLGERLRKLAQLVCAYFDAFSAHERDELEVELRDYVRRLE
jgi:hypothetical protein